MSGLFKNKKKKDRDLVDGAGRGGGWGQVGLLLFSTLFGTKCFKNIYFLTLGYLVWWK